MPAVLEQWEIDLKNQLLEGPQSEREWEERLRNELRDVPSLAIGERNGFERLALCLVILCLMAAAGFVYNQKVMGQLLDGFKIEFRFHTQMYHKILLCHQINLVKLLNCKLMWQK